MFSRVHAIVIPLVLVGLLGFCFVKTQQTTDGVVQALRATLLVEQGGEQGDPSRMTFQQLRQIMGATKYYRMGFYGGVFFLLVYMIVMATWPASQPEMPAFKQVSPTPRPAPSTPQQGRATPRPAPSTPQQEHPVPKQGQPVPQQTPSARQRPLPGPVRLADDVPVEDEQPMLTAELPRPTGIVMRANDPAAPVPQRPLPDSVRLADDVGVEDEEPMLTAELPRPTDIVTRSDDSERSR